MLDPRSICLLATRIPRAFSGATLHRAALQAIDRGDYRNAQRLLAHAAEKYRADIRVQELARLRVHELICRVRAAESSDRESELMIQVERLLSRLERIESLEPPFELVDAHVLLASWLGARGRPVSEGLEPVIVSRAA